MNFVEELKWRGMLHDVTPGLVEELASKSTTGYVGFDPTADSLHIGNLVPVMLLVHLQRAGHRPLALVGGATGMVGDPSGKTAERQLLDPASIAHNLACQKKQLEKFLDFTGDNAAMVVNNHDWFKNFNFLDFIRDVGKHITINYMMAKDSVKNRLEAGMSFTEFSYQLVQGYDFLYLFRSHDCKLQMGGSDQWGNMLTGTELVRRVEGGQAYALTAPLITKSDGSKFGKSEGGNIWIDKARTSAYTFYQYWINAADTDAGRYLRIFTLMDREQIEALEAEHAENPGARIMQKALAADMTRRVHSEQDLATAVAASALLFGKSSEEDLRSLPPAEILSVFEGVPRRIVDREALAEGISVIDLLAGGETPFLASNSDARRSLKENAISLNKTKLQSDRLVTTADLIGDEFLVLQRGKKNYFTVRVS